VHVSTTDVGRCGLQGRVIYVELNRGYNHAILLGTVSAGPWKNTQPERSECVAFSLAIPQPSTKTGEIFNTYVRVECYGRTLDDASGLHAGDVVHVDGKLAWQRGSGEGKAALGVLAFRVLRLARAANSERIAS
jgi:hypothetical protein